MNPASPAGADRRRRLDLERLSRWLTAYGIVGLAVAVIALGALVVGIGRVGALGDRLTGDASGVSATLERTATVLDDAAATAGGFGTTLDTSTTALSSAAADLRQIVPRLRDLETQANAVNILGNQPLGQLGGLFGQIAGQISDLDTQLDSVATKLGGNRSALVANAASLASLAGQTRTLADRLGSDTVGATIDDIRWLLVAVLLVGMLGAALPAAGALIGGLWLRRWLADDGEAGPRRSGRTTRGR